MASVNSHTVNVWTAGHARCVIEWVEWSWRSIENSFASINCLCQRVFLGGYIVRTFSVKSFDWKNKWYRFEQYFFFLLRCDFKLCCMSVFFFGAYFSWWTYSSVHTHVQHRARLPTEIVNKPATNTRWLCNALAL